MSYEARGGEKWSSCPSHGHWEKRGVVVVVSIGPLEGFQEEGRKRNLHTYILSLALGLEERRKEGRKKERKTP